MAISQIRERPQEELGDGDQRERNRGARLVAPAPREREAEREQRRERSEPDVVQHRDREVRGAVAAPVAHVEHPERRRDGRDQHDRDDPRRQRERQGAERQKEDRDRRRVDEAVAGRDARGRRRRIRVAAVEHVAGRLPERAVEIEGVAVADRPDDDGQREQHRSQPEQAELPQAPERRERACQRAGMRDVRHTGGIGRRGGVAEHRRTSARDGGIVSARVRGPGGPPDAKARTQP